MCRVSLKDRKRNVDSYSLLDIQILADVGRRGRLKWFGHLEHKSVDDWVLACRNMEVAGVRRCRGRNRKPWRECVDGSVWMEVVGLQPEWQYSGILFRDMWKKWTFSK